jgi:hypothetical protein
LFNKRFNAGLRAARCARLRYAAAKTLIRYAGLRAARCARLRYAAAKTLIR